MNRDRLEVRRRLQRRLDRGATAVALLLSGAGIVAVVSPTALVHHGPETLTSRHTSESLTRPSGHIVLTVETAPWSTPAAATTRPQARQASTITTDLRDGLEPTIGSTLEYLAVPREALVIQSSIDATRAPRR